MAETNNRKKPAADPSAAGKTAAKKSASKTATASPAKKSSGRTGTSRAKTATAAEKKPSAKKGNAKAAPKDSAQQTVDPPRKHTFSEQFLPYILAVVGIFLGACFLLNIIGGAETPDEHLMGPVGYWICYFLFGCFGWTAYLIPLVFFNLAFFWKRYCREGLVPLKVILSVLLMVLLSAVIHVAVCHADPAMAEVYDVTYLYNTGAVFESGGVIGGLVGYVLYKGLRLPGTVVLAVVTLPLLIMCLVGVTPAYVFGKLWTAIKVWWEKRAAEKAARAEEKAAEAEAEKKAATTESYRARRARMGEEEATPATETAEARTAKTKPAKAVAADTDGQAIADGEPTADTDREAVEKRAIRLDPMTGEVLEEGTSTEAAAAPEKKSGGLFKSRKDQPTGTADRDEPVVALPLFEPAPVPASEEEDSLNTVEVVAAERTPSALRTEAEDDLPWEESDDGYVAKAYSTDEGLYPDEEDGLYDGEPDSMDVDFDDDADELSPTVNYEVVSDGTQAPVSRTAGEPVTVRILKSETAAVAEAGLSEEELVLPSGYTEEGAAEANDETAREYTFPPVDLLTKGTSRYEANEAEIAANTQTLREVLESFHIRVKEISCSCGPTITRFEVKPESGIRVRSIANLVDDIAMGLAKAGVRIEAPIPGKAAVGIEVPNAEPSTVYFRNILETPEFRNHKSRIAACLGADVSGRPVILDINKMPHLLVAGTTGSGKSVCINSIIMSILYKAKPDEVKLILIDPKKVEFAVYRDLPHLYCPLISDPKKAAGALNSAVNEMERRFELIEEVGVRNLAGYNEITAGDPERPPLPQMVIIIDELADLMMTASNEVETAICRLAQKARAAGIHLILGTQRPSTDVITGLIKANIPSRIAFTVTQQIDSRIIIDSVGAEKLIGRGDMLYSPVGTTKPMRVQGTFVSDGEVERVVTFIKEHNEKGEFDESFTRQIEIEAAKCGMGKKRGEQMSIDDFDGLGGGRKDNEDPKFWEALEVAVGKDKIGTSALQRALNLGYGRAAKIIDRMEELGFVGPDPGTKQGRKVYITKQDLMEYKLNGLPSAGGNGDAGDEDAFNGL